MELDNNREINDPSDKKSMLRKYWWIGLVLIAIIIVVFFVVLGATKKANREQGQKSQQNTVSVPKSIPTVLTTSASAITSPPPSMEGINTHTELYGGTGADPNLITLGPTDGFNPKGKKGAPYSGKRGMEFELGSKSPLLAPLDMTLVGFQNNSVREGTGADGKTYSPFNDIVLYFESASSDWPGMFIVAYHLYSSPLLSGHYQNTECGDVEAGSKNTPAEGHLFFPYDDYIAPSQGNAEACQALIGRTVKRGELIGYAGNVGNHSFASFCFKVPDKSINPTVKQGNRNLHWVQPASFFYWKSYSLNAIFPLGVLAYPFEIDGYQLPAEQRDANFKYTSTK